VRGLEASVKLLAPGGRLVVVSFHSLEDRLVKRFMQDAAGRTPGPSRHDPAGLVARHAAEFTLLTGGAERPGPDETRANPRARSARLRALARLPSPLFQEIAP
jgi:16S rRNA (cytosine1402-N4)-methyltransferase